MGAFKEGEKMRPDKVILGAHKWDILWKSVPEPIKEAYDIEEASGLFYDPGARIYVEPELSLQRQKITLLHEIIHAMSLCHGLAFDEDKTEAFANALYDLIKQNPGLIAWVGKG